MLGYILLVWLQGYVLNAHLSLSKDDSNYLDLLRGVSIFRVVLAHLGLSWIYPPYSGYIMIFLPVLFFVSGAVSFYSFRRCTSVYNFLYKRLITIGAPYYVIVLFSFIIFWMFDGWKGVDYYSIYQWLSFNPVAVSDSMPYPMGQVWFLHVLVLLTILSPLIFAFSVSRPFILIIPIVISFIFALVQNLQNIGLYFIFDKHNFFQALSNMGFYFFGAYYYANIERFSNSVLIVLSLILSSVAVVLAVYINSSNAMPDHAYNPDLFYISISFVAIFILLVIKPWVVSFVDQISFLKKTLLFVSYHSYSIYMLHSLLIFWSEKFLGLKGVMGEPLLAVYKVIFVLAGTALLSVPVSYISKKVTAFLRYRVVSKHYLITRKAQPSLKDV